MNNPLLVQRSSKHKAFEFDKYLPEHFVPAIQGLISKNLSKIDEIAHNDEAPSFKNTLEALEYMGQDLEDIISLLFNLNAANTSEKLQKVAQEVAPLLSEYQSKISQNEDLFYRIREVYEKRKDFGLTTEQNKLLEETYKGFVRNGALLEKKEQKNLEEINKNLSLKSLKFGENVLAATNAWHLHLNTVERLEGIPDSLLDGYREEAKNRGLEGFVITLQFPSLIPILTYVHDRTLREQVWRANASKAFCDEWDNQILIREIVDLRQKKAEILGCKNYAEYILEERMAENPERVEHFLQEIASKARPYAENELESLKALADEDGVEEMQPWDHSYYAEKLRKRELELDEETLRPYFELRRVEDAAFQLAKKLYGIEFRSVSIPGYHEEVNTYEVWEDGRFLALFYTDYFPRKSKRAGAWMTSYQSQYIHNQQNQRPHISVVCNFTKPTADRPSLLTFQEVTTLFHEFGHALHGILADTTYPGLSGTSVKWDFVELPSQFMENYCYEPEFLQTFAHHYQTGEALPVVYLEKIQASKRFLEGYQTLRQIGFGLLDMAYHSGQLKEEESIRDFETRILAPVQLYPVQEDTAHSTSFSHIFQGGYAAGYYSYKWAEVLDADAFAYFKKEGLYDQKLAQKFRKLLSSGGTVDPMLLYKNFRGREPKVEALVSRSFG